MKRLTAIIAILLVAVSLSAQNSSTYLNEMRSMKQKFGVSFVYDSSLTLDRECRRLPSSSNLKKSLATLFGGSGIEYEINGKTVILHKARTDMAANLAELKWVVDTIAPSLIESAWADTLVAAVKTDDRRMAQTIGRLATDLPSLRGVISPLGEGDPIRWAQALPGVTTGADGTSAIYVRGGNMGNNLFTLDGVPVYGYSHLLSLTTVVPQGIMKDVALSKGGFEGGQSNFTSSHLSIDTKVPEARKTSISLNNFLLSADTEGSFNGRMSYIFSARVSPLMFEYRAFRKMMPELLGGFDGFNASVGDLYGKFHWAIGDGRWLDVSALGGLDSYSFDVSANSSHDSLGWSNVIGMVRYHGETGPFSTDLLASVNRYGSRQIQDKFYRGSQQTLSLRSCLTEFTLSFDQAWNPSDNGFGLTYGLNVRDAIFAPGQVASVLNKSNSMLATAYLQADYDIRDKLALMAVVRANAYAKFGSKYFKFVPDASLSAKWMLTRHFGLEASFDRVTQFYHTLEGLPVGWSIDMMVPSGNTVAPEGVLQANAGIDLVFGGHSLSAGGFWKRMDGLVYYKYSKTLFSGALAAWEDNVDIGFGHSYGAEFLYEYQGRDFNGRVAYTWSKTDREGFADINDGAPFHARFDRRHVLNVTAGWKGISASFIYQSGHWENGDGVTYQMHAFDGEEWTAEYYSGVNNYHMPYVLRLDLGYQFAFDAWGCRHEVNLGVCNVTNHFNPFMLYFDAASESWMEISLLPVLPNFSYRVTF